ncbi:MAG: hypothetical protein HYS24_12870 [Ignavibacteriales bacterium]|jgi:hypothetical protein|nr:hypothetical protein [Ignavibacteriales bacterium]MBK7981103.1 hypothetical protein [Ignavibacteriota bacterium]
MELIPVFAFIVLVASIATFIFSIAAYILYKIRERKGRFNMQTHPKAFQAELVAPNYFYLPENGDFDNKKFTSNNPGGNSNKEHINAESKSFDQNNGNELVWR